MNFSVRYTRRPSGGDHSPKLFLVRLFLLVSLFYSTLKQQPQTTAHSKIRLEENILYNEIIYFHISLHPIQGYKLPSYIFEGAIRSFLLKTHFQKSNKLSLTNTYILNFKLIRWRGSSLVATRFLRQKSRVSKPAVSEQTIKI